MSNIDKLIKLLNKETYLEADILIKKSNDIIETLSSPMAYTESLVEELKKILIPEESLDDNELNFISNWAKTQESTRRYLLANDTEIASSEFKMFDDIKNRIVKSKEFYESKKNNEIDVNILIKKLIGKKRGIITSNEIEFIIEKIKEELSISQQIEILKEINEKNVSIFNNYGIQVDEALEINEIEDELEETNIDTSEIEALLESFGMDFSKFAQEDKEKLARYGNLNNMESVLMFLVKERVIPLIKLYPEIITKTLLYSSVEKLNILKKNSNVEFLELVRRIPTVLYPVTNTRTYSLNHGGQDNFSSTNSGKMTDFLENKKILEENNVSVDEVWERCFTFFKNSHKANRNSIKLLKSYGISLFDENGNLREMFSVLGLRNPSVIDVYDLAIEADAKEYALANPSSLSSIGSYKFYLIKAARKQGLQETEIFGNYSRPDKEIFLKKTNILSKLALSENIDSIYNQYQAVNINIPNKALYDNLFNIIDVNEISSEVLSDENINALEKFAESDELYNFNGTRISRKKVLRRYTTLKNNNKVSGLSALMYCIIYGSMLDEKEFNNIYDLVRRVVPLESDGEIGIIKDQYVDENSDLEINPANVIGGSKNE